MAKKELFNDDELKALINLVGVFDKADPDGIIYNMPVSTSDTLLELIDSNKNLLDEEKARLKENFDKRKKNQIAVENLSRRATDIQRGKNLLRVREEREEQKDDSDLEL